MLSRVVRRAYYKSGFRTPARSYHPREPMDADRHLAKVVEFLSGAEADDRVGGVGGFEANSVLVAAVGLHREVAIYAGDDDVAAGGAERTVDDKEVSVMDSLADHRLALNLDEERGGWTLHQQLV